MPLKDANLLGTEKDGTRSTIYCSYCYQDGVFTHPGMTLGEMRSHLQGLMKSMGMNTTQIGDALATLPQLKRWISV